MSTTSLQRLLNDALSREPSCPAPLEPGPSLSYRDLHESAAAVAGGLWARGIRPGERVAWRLPNGPEAVLLSLACCRIGAISVPINPRLVAADVRSMLASIDSRCVLLPEDEAAEAVFPCCRT